MSKSKTLSKQQVRRIVLVAVLCALGVAGRAAFAWLPNGSPMLGIIMISGLALGWRDGLLVGVMSAVASNFIFGQGVWTLFQLSSYGLAGFVFGLFHANDLGYKKLLALSVLGGLFVLVIVGPILDMSTFFFMMSRITPEAIVAVLLAGIPFNCIHAASTLVTLLFLTKPILFAISHVNE